ncbi:MAG: hypothetical protein JJU02_04680 [Cryomorphaceae bacterium]|nr:hypothetical protein [Cryomorphaceae bacterium]
MLNHKTNYAMQLKLLILILCIGFWGNLQGQMILLPHYSSGQITEITLKNGEIYRGKVIRVVPWSYIAIRFPSKETTTINVSDIKESKPVFPNITENSLSLNLGVKAISTLPPSTSDLMLLGVVGINNDFGKDLKYSFLAEFSQGGLVSEKPFLNGDYLAVSLAVAIGYKLNRNKKISQSYFIGLRRFLGEDYNIGYLTHRFELPITIRNNRQIIPFVEYNHLPSANLENGLKHIFNAGIVIRFYTLSAYF